jgi:ATP-dependent Clp protease ATP-binding subunit ClpA
MHDKFTERVRKVIYLAREEAARLQHDYIGTEHLLLGVIREGEGIAATVLNNLGLDLDRIRQEVENMVSASGGTMTIGEIPFTPRAKRVLELAVEEARSLGHNYVGTEHLLLGPDPRRRRRVQPRCCSSSAWIASACARRRSSCWAARRPRPAAGSARSAPRRPR